MLEICLRFAWYKPEICLRYAWDMPEICLRYAWDMPEIYLRYASDMPVICLRYAWYTAANKPEIIGWSLCSLRQHSPMSENFLTNFYIYILQTIFRKRKLCQNIFTKIDVFEIFLIRMKEHNSQNFRSFTKFSVCIIVIL